MTESAWLQKYLPAALAAAARMQRVVLLLLAAAVSTAPHVLAQSRVVTVPGAVACSGCTLGMTLVARLGSERDSVLLGFASHPPVVDSKGRYFTTSVDGRTIVVYGPTGQFEKSFGRIGGGPAEIAYPFPVIQVGAGDSLFVYSDRVKIFTPAQTWARMTTLPLTPLSVQPLSDGQTLVVGSHIQAGSDSSFPVHMIDRTGRIVASFGSTGKLPVRCGRCFRVAAALNPVSREIWVASPGSYSLARWNAGGQLLEQLHVDASWFERWDPLTHRPAGPGSSVPHVWSMGVDAAGLVWLTIVTPLDASGSSGAGAGAMVQSAALTRNPFSRWKTTLQAYDPRTRSIVAHRVFDRQRVEIVGDGMVAVQVETKEGHVLWDVFQPRINNR